jgi:hypothetical protein
MQIQGMASGTVRSFNTSGGIPTIQLTAQVERTTLAPEADLVMQTGSAAEPVRLQSRVRRLHRRAIGFT